MPDRLLRDELLDSDRYWALPTDTHRMLFTHLVLTADDLGNSEATPRLMGARLLNRQATPQECDALLRDLKAVDIARPYEVDGKRYVHIPRFRQRLRSHKRVNPRPPPEIEDKEIKALLSNMTDNCPTPDTHEPDNCPTPAVEGRKEGRKEVKNRAHAREPVDNSPAAQRKNQHPTGKESPKGNGKPPANWRTDPDAAKAYGATFDCHPLPGERTPDYVARIDRLKAMLGPGQLPRRAAKPP